MASPTVFHDLADDPEGTAAGEGARDGVPLYAQQAVDWNTVNEARAPAKTIGGGRVAADVDNASPTTINVRSPQDYTPDVRAHESEHVVQNVIGDAAHGAQGSSFMDSAKEVLGVTHNAASAAGASSGKDYDYGGYDGLLQMRQQGKGAQTLSREQQGAMVGNYVKDARALEDKARAGTLTPQEGAQYQKMQQAVHPMLRELATPANAPIDTHPQAPGLPGPDVMGYMVPDKQMGGGWTKVNANPPGKNPYMAEAKPKGLVEQGNLPIWNRPTVKNADGSHSTEYSTSFQDDKGREVLVPTVVGGKFLTPDGKKPPQGSAAEKTMFQAAWQHYQKTGEHLGKFDNPGNADAYAGKLHNRDQGQPIHTAGNGQPLSKDNAAQYLHRAGGDKQLARAFALHDKHTF